EHSRTIYVINFNPRTESYFSGIVWIDSTSCNIQKITLSIKDAKNHPFQLMGHQEGEGLSHVNLEITKTFKAQEGRMYVDKIDFEYELTYKSNNGIEQKINSHAILFAYNYKEHFFIPKFRFEDSPSIDYIQILTIPRDSIFCSQIAEFSLNDADRTN